MSRQTDTAADPSSQQGDASATDQQELYGRRAPTDLQPGPGVGLNDDDQDAADADPGQGQDASGHPSTARTGANTL